MMDFLQRILWPFQDKMWWKKGLMWALVFLIPWALGLGSIIIIGTWFWNTYRILKKYPGLPTFESGYESGLIALTSWSIYGVVFIFGSSFVGHLIPDLRVNGRVFLLLELVLTLVWLVAMIRFTLGEHASVFLRPHTNAYLILSHPLATLQFLVEMGILTILASFYIVGYYFLWRDMVHAFFQPLETPLIIVVFLMFLIVSPIAAVLIVYSPSAILAHFAEQLGLRIGKSKQKAKPGEIYSTFGLPKRKMKNGLIAVSYMIQFKPHRGHISNSGVLRKLAKVKIRRLAEERL